MVLRATSVRCRPAAPPHIRGKQQRWRCTFRDRKGYEGLAVPLVRDWHPDDGIPWLAAKLRVMFLPFLLLLKKCFIVRIGLYWI